MNSVLRSAFRANNLRVLLNPARNMVPSNTGSQRQLARNLWYMCNSKNEQTLASKWKVENPSTLCSCGCGSNAIHTKGKLKTMKLFHITVLLHLFDF